MASRKLKLLSLLALLFLSTVLEASGTSSSASSSDNGAAVPTRGRSLSSQSVFSLDRYGARGDGKHDDTPALVKAWKAACSSSAPAVVLVPKGKRYLLKLVSLAGPCKSSSILVSVQGTLVASPNRGDWNDKNRRHWIVFRGVNKLTVNGGGTVDGSGETWWKNSCKINKALGGSGYAKDITFQNIIMDNVKNPIIVDQNYCDKAKPCKAQGSAVEVSNVVFKNIRGTTITKEAIKLTCSKNVPCHDITLQNIDLKMEGGKGAAESICQNAKWRKSGTVLPQPCTSKN
ncbi:hypothetical protein PR202_gb10541 [Eleusine coracana subsp. coracana]|uniref:Polygalacturonase n=1 Tax=Eleusine coracana subsp. coracana TaxID=191504 RepID=A0AAV5EK92_ELECO|nr:hypothetical protein PR202_gb10541 [Eleusine coracana subsp. coracana]